MSMVISIISFFYILHLFWVSLNAVMLLNYLYNDVNNILWNEPWKLINTQKYSLSRFIGNYLGEFHMAIERKL